MTTCFDAWVADMAEIYRCISALIRNIPALLDPLNFFQVITGFHKNSTGLP